MSFLNQLKTQASALQSAHGQQQLNLEENLLGVEDACRNARLLPVRLIGSVYTNMVRGVPDVLFFLFFPLAICFCPSRCLFLCIHLALCFFLLLPLAIRFHLTLLIRLFLLLYGCYIRISRCRCRRCSRF